MSRISVDKYVLLMSLAFGLLLVFLTPPLQVPDEINHFHRAYQIAQGDWIPEKRGELTGGTLPKALIEMRTPLMQDVPFKHWNKVDWDEVRSIWSWRVQQEERRFVGFNNTALHSPVAYAPQSFVYFLLRPLELSPLWLLYLGRVVNLLAATALLYWALRVLPQLNWMLGLVALLPMSVFLRASLSADAVTHALAFVVVALAGKSLLNSKQEPPSSLFFGIACLLSLAKQTYFFLPFLTLAIPPQRYGGWRRYFKFHLVLGTTVFGALFSWLYLVKDSSSPIVPGANPLLQLNVVWQDPFAVVGYIVHHYFEKGWNTLSELVGILGWLDTILPTWYWRIYGVTLLLTPLFSNPGTLTLGLRQRAWIFLIFVASLLLVGLLIYLTGMPVGAEFLRGIQGRYLIPLIPIGLLGLSYPLFRPARFPLTFFYLWPWVSITVTFLAMTHRYGWPK